MLPLVLQSAPHGHQRKESVLAVLQIGSKSHHLWETPVHWWDPPNGTHTSTALQEGKPCGNLHLQVVK